MEAGAQYGAIVAEQPSMRLDLRGRAVPSSYPSADPVQTTILIPAYNEEAALPHVLEAIFDVIDDTYEVLVINDGSQDGTYAVAAAFPCRIISHATNQGKGAAMRTGFRYARGENIIVIDGDATYPAEAIPEVAAQLRHYDLVRCVRTLGRDNIPLVNRLGNQFFDQIIRHIHRVDGSDMLSGLYGLRRQHLNTMRLRSDGFDIESEIMIKARAMHLTMHNIPIQYNERIGEKKLAPVRDGIKILVRIFSLAMMFNPFAMYIIPGFMLWLIGLAALVLVGREPVIPALASLSTHALVVSAMSFLAGFQLIVFGCIVNLYAVETGLGRPSRTLSLAAAKSPRLSVAVLGVVLMLVGGVWSLHLGTGWIAAGGGPFVETKSLVVALAMVIWGMQLLSTMFFLSLFAGSYKYAIAKDREIPVTEHQSTGVPAMPEVVLERAVGEV